MSYFKSILRNIWKDSSVEKQYSVREVSSQLFLTASLVARADFLLLYERELAAGKAFEVIACKHVNQSPNNVFSLFQTNEETEAEIFFCSLNDVLTPLLTCYPHLLNSKELLQALCNTVRYNPSWSAVHVAASLGWAECFKHDEIIQQKDKVCPVTNVTPLHLAVLGNWPNLIDQLLSLEANVSAKERNGNNALHCAAGGSKRIIQALCSRATSTTINERNNSGYTPLHLACLADNPECFREFLCSGADLNISRACDSPPTQSPPLSTDRVKEILDKYPKLLQTKDFSSGGTFLHWAGTPDCTEVLIECGCSVDARNFNGDTALHVMVQRGHLPCLLTLLINNANPNISNCDGDTPLHLAASSGNEDMVQALVVFGAEVNWVNGRGDSARHLAAISESAESNHILYMLHAVGAQRCFELREDCSVGCSFWGEYNGIPPTEFQPEMPDICNDSFAPKDSPHSQKRRSSSGGETSGCRKKQRRGGGGRVLCLDGGGIRGLLMIQALSVLEKILGAPVTQCFDWIAGTSTGAIVALALSLGRSLRECRQLYFQMKDKVFVGMRPYPSEPFEKVLQEEFGSETVMADIKNIKVMVTSFLADGQSPKLHLFRNYDSPEKIRTQMQDNSGLLPAPQEEQLVWKAARASTAAPTYFEPFHIFLDGGLIANNPTLDALTEIHQYNSAMEATGQMEQCEPLSVVVSVGCGMFPSASAECINMSRPDSIWNIAKIVLKEIPTFLYWFADRTTETDGRVVERAQACCNMNGASYFRINAPLSKPVSFNEKDNCILIKSLWETMAYMHSQENQLNELKSVLTSYQS